MATTLKERLKLAMKGPPVVKPVDLARACNIKPPSVSGWLSGETKTLAGKNLLAAARLLNVNVEWLGTGKGPMRTVHATEVTGDEYSPQTPSSESRFVGLSTPTLHEALTLLDHDIEQAGEFPTLLARTERLAELYRRIEANGGHLSADGIKRLGEEIEQRRGKHGRAIVGGKRGHGRH